MDERVLNVVDYSIEVWDWHTNKYIADLTDALIDGIRIDWLLNDVEQVDFTLDLVQFEDKCRLMGVRPSQVLTPYVHDIRIRRNGEYLVGVQVVETNITIDNDRPPEVQVRCTGFLNLFKDQYVSIDWSGKTYSEIAQSLVEYSQKPDCIIKNPTVALSASYWLPVNGSMSWVDNRIVMAGHIWPATGTEMSCTAGVPVHVELEAAAPAGKEISVRERRTVTDAATQVTLHVFSAGAGGFQFSSFDFTPTWSNSYLIVESNVDNTSQQLWLRNCFVTEVRDADIYHNLGVENGVNETTGQSPRDISYSLQNVKDALMDLTGMETDKFDFSFAPDRTFNCYDRLGEDKVEIEAVYPGNIHSMVIGRSASNLANKITNIGSGIGDERIQKISYGQASRITYGNRESIITNNNVTQESVLQAQSEGELQMRSAPTNSPKIVIRDGSINPSNVKLGDTILVKVEDDEWMGTVNGLYRIIEYNLETDRENVETVTLTLDNMESINPVNPIRYIKNTVSGNTASQWKQWIEIEALVRVGDHYENVALGKPVGASPTISNPARVTDGIIEDSIPNRVETDADGKQSVWIDLGDEYPVSYIKVWHVYFDRRRYYDNVLSVGRTLTEDNEPLEQIVWDYTDSPYIETNEGMCSKFLQEGGA